MLDFRATPNSGVAEVLLLGGHQENACDASPAGGTSPRTHQSPEAVHAQACAHTLDQSYRLFEVL
jgi:hypothetical protein